MATAPHSQDTLYILFNLPRLPPDSHDHLADYLMSNAVPMQYQPPCVGGTVVEFHVAVAGKSSLHGVIMQGLSFDMEDGHAHFGHSQHADGAPLLFKRGFAAKMRFESSFFPADFHTWGALPPARVLQHACAHDA